MRQRGFTDEKVKGSGQECPLHTIKIGGERGSPPVGLRRFSWIRRRARMQRTVLSVFR
jgi:hypothetical protein